MSSTQHTSWMEWIPRWRYWILFSLILLIIFYTLTRTGHISATPQTCPTPAAEEKNSNEEDTILLIWFWPFKTKFDLTSCASKFHINGCQLTVDRNLYSSADGVLIHHRDIDKDLSNLPKLPRPFFQKWIWMLFESPENSEKNVKLDKLFNVTMSYRRDADIVVREQLEIKPKETEEPIPIKPKTELVCWIVSNWNDNHARVKYYYELKKHIDIKTFGRNREHGVLSDKDYTRTIENCKFYLSFENTLKTSDHTAIDYMTEKLYNPLRLGTVPVVLGPPRDSYEKFIPGHIFIHVDDFKSPEHLASHLRMLDKDEEKYRQFFSWRKYFRVTNVNFPHEHACRACQYIRERKNFQVFTNLTKWYWG